MPRASSPRRSQSRFELRVEGRIPMAGPGPETTAAKTCRTRSPSFPPATEDQLQVRPQDGPKNICLHNLLFRLSKTQPPFLSAPQWRRSPVGEGPTHEVVGRHGSYRAVEFGRSLETKSGLAGRATWQAVMRVKPEQASKVKSWTPTRLRNGEGSTGREGNRPRHRFGPSG